MTIHRITIFISAFALAMFTVTAAQADSCDTIQFQRGHNSATVKSVVSPNGMICYAITTAAGQTACIEIIGENVIFSVGGVADAQGKYRFTTEKKTYSIHISQLMRSVTDQPFTLHISVE
ncbi:hypothetical protein SAMN05421690_101039 [Nitrosomonas sp. Nm51]|uniref:hypothetical protein n=1 Tax=Nitrosomonas sp. Nm51 TaxID=133720 RepID=UPI0008D0BF31|nr:hypothetical protein [Nitrosomonas sp. Nm51]SER15684.1 hypothetical protein SAMN05421690_101039 [Nitrosomonas sp. Nm51]